MEIFKTVKTFQPTIHVSFFVSQRIYTVKEGNPQKILRKDGGSSRKLISLQNTRIR